MVKSGLPVGMAIFMSLLVFAGSAQLAVIPLLSVGAPLWVVWLTASCVNLRFVIFSSMWRSYFAHLPLRQRMKLSFVMGDTSFALFIRRFPEPLPGRPYEDYFLGSALVTFGVWQVATITGIVLGHGIPEAWNLGFAGTMALLALTCTQLRNPVTGIAAVVAGCAAVAAYALPLKLNIIAAIAAAVAVGVLAGRAPRLRAGAGS